MATVLLWASAVVAEDAGAFDAKPFGIASVGLEATAGTEIVNEGSGTACDPCHLVKVPYETPFTQAGGRPWALTATGSFTNEELLSSHDLVPTRDPKDVVATLPVGLLGDPEAVPRCPLTTLLGGEGLKACPSSTQIGVARLHVFGSKELVGPIVNISPETGQSAEFGIENPSNVNIVLTAHLVHTTDGYGFAVSSKGIPLVELYEYELTFWGVPADPSHNPLRGLFCATNSNGGTHLSCQGGGEQSTLAPVPFLAWPTDCSAGPETATIRADSWQEPGRVLNGQDYEGYVEKQVTIPAPSGCDLLKFDPTIELQPDTVLADEPVGVGLKIDVPQPEKPDVNATPHLRDATVTLPQGMSISPSAVDGVQACEATGPAGINISGPESEEIGPSGELQLAPGHCPDASIVGTAEAETPLLPAPVKGHIYLAKPGCGASGQPACTEQDALDGTLYKLYLELGGSGEFATAGIQIKVEGQVHANTATGQLTTTFRDNPQAPFSELRVSLNGGPRSPLDNPAKCGPAVTMSDFTPWSAPGVTPEGLLTAGTNDATPSSYFDVNGCSGQPALAPGFVAGTVSPRAGRFSAFTLNLTRQDREQYLAGVQVQTPPGLLGVLASVELCKEPQAAAGTCSLASKIGTTRVASGAGSHPFEIGGNVYLTTGYKGAPFGLSIVTDAVAGPFNLGLVVVRAAIHVDPSNSQLTVTSDPLPQIVFGVPLRLKRISVEIDRPSFMFNPTNCSGQRISTTVTGSEGANTTVSSPFAVGGCAGLAFKPKFTVATDAHTSRAIGASLDAKVSYPAHSMGSEANIARVKVSLPKQLPSRLTTLQKACPARTFEANPSGCPGGAIVGIARANTPVLPAQLLGPVYFVSHGGEAFPSLVVVLQGDGVRVDLVGTTFISKAGITSSTFQSVPDVPVNSFELYLPSGRFSALAANGNLCASLAKLIMPTTFIAQNGAQLKQSTKIAVTGCKTGKPKRAARRARSASLAHRRSESGRAQRETGIGR